MPITERRHSPRTKPDQLAYVNIEPDNGGIILNVSQEGLCFRAISPIVPAGPLRISLQDLNRKISIGGELVWTDDFKKSGGLRFHTLTREARDCLSHWTQPPDRAQEAGSTLGAALLKAFPSSDSRRVNSSLRPAVSWWRSGRRMKISGFTRGVAAGILLSLCAFSALLFSYQHRADFGESLIRIGKRLAGNQGAGTAPPPLPGQTVAVPSPAPLQAVIPVENESLGKRSTHIPSSQVDADPDDVTVRLFPQPPRSRIASPPPTPAESLKNETDSAPALPVSASVNATDGLFAGLEPPVSMSQPDPLVAPRHSEIAPSFSASPTLSKVEMFFDLGRFKREPVAQKLREKLAALGIESTVISKRRLWGNSYQVLAGPYDDHEAERQIYAALLTHGYKPRPFERGSRDFAFRSKVTIDGSLLTAGLFTVAWESYISEARVRFSQGDGLFAAVDGIWVKRPTRFTQNEYVYQIRPNGSRSLLELHFGGMDRALVFAKVN